MKSLRPWAAMAICALVACATALTPEQRKLNVDSFEYAWKTIQNHMWEPMPAGVDWQQVHDELKPKVEAAANMDQAREAIANMISRLKLTHFGIMPADIYERLDAGKSRKAGGGSPGFDIRLIDGQALVVSIEDDAPARVAGVRPGWALLGAGGTDIAELTTKMHNSLPATTVRPLLITRAIAATLEGAPGSRVHTEFLDGRNRRVKLDIQLKEPRGGAAGLGFLPTQHFWYEAKKLGRTGYIRFNMFLDPGRISTRFGESVQSWMDADGIIIDLHGNPGGIGGMSMGMAGWFIDKPGVPLGVMKTREGSLKFTVNPRAEVFRGPLAILVDSLTASTSEIFAEGLKDLGRAHIIGTRTAGAALPSVFERLPNGDGFQYAIANYISEGGQPLEGAGVTPDQPVALTREALLAGRDPVVDAALEWIRKEGKKE